jgi:hypothetical protein
MTGASVSRLPWALLVLFVVTAPALAQEAVTGDSPAGSEAATTADPPAQSEAVAAEAVTGADEASTGSEPVPADGPVTLSGMSILGNNEAPTSLVIVPWKSSEIGDGIGLRDSLNAAARPVDRDVFMRELRYYEIRAGE